MSTSFYVYETQAEPKSSRTCTQCSWEMSEGFLHEDSGGSYCTTSCLNKAFTQKEQDAMSIDELFWTDWHGEAEVAE